MSYTCTKIPLINIFILVNYFVLFHKRKWQPGSLWGPIGMPLDLGHFLHHRNHHRFGDFLHNFEHVWSRMWSSYSLCGNISSFPLTEIFLSSSTLPSLWRWPSWVPVIFVPIIFMQKNVLIIRYSNHHLWAINDQNHQRPIYQKKINVSKCLFLRFFILKIFERWATACF